MKMGHPRVDTIGPGIFCFKAQQAVN